MLNDSLLLSGSVLWAVALHTFEVQIGVRMRSMVTFVFCAQALGCKCTPWRPTIFNFEFATLHSALYPQVGGKHYTPTGSR